MEEKMKRIKNTITFLFMCLMVFSFGYSSNSVDLKDQIERKRQNQMHPEQEKINYYFNNFGSIPEESELTIINNRDCDSDDQTEYSWSCGNGSWGSEISWQLSASGDTTVIANGGAPTAGTICLADGDYTLTMIDSYGDGWNGNVFVVSSLDSTDATVFASCTLDTGLNGECSFSLGGAPPVSGCTNPNAPNYDADAVLDDGSCEDFCLGNLDSGSCGYFMDLGGYTCETLEGFGYDCTACADAGVCDAPLECAEGQFMCSSGDQCIPESYLCDGSSEYGNAGWGPDCTDGSDEILEDCCAAGALSYEGYCPDVGDVPGCTDVEACNFDELATFDNGSCLFNDCNGECGGAAVEDCNGVCGGTALTDACGECEGDGSACAGCANASYYADSYCDASNNTAECNYDGGDCCPSDCLDPGANDPNDLYDCETNGGDCLDCIDPSSADLAEGGECDPNVDPPTAPTGLACEGGYDVVDGPTINLSWDAVEGAENYEVFYYLPSCEEQGLVTCWDGTCAESEDDCSVQGECAEGEVLDCAEGDFDCVTAAWIGDGYCDGTAQAYGADLCCFDLDGGDCTPAECGDTTPVDCPAEWNACLASIVDTEYYEACADPDCTGGAGGSCDGSVVPFLTDECGAAANNIGGGVCPDPCGGDAGTGCAVGEFECGDGSCIPGSYYCDGSSEYGNAFWGPDCADGSDEVLADCCDAGAASYNGYCGGDTGGDDAGGDDA
ncbi:MAG: hypothetical protein CMF96_01705, partial [Candidatus Marinimicrobia bacterium]|nr:hypothetical protein [Candidatus Neomarinimicrobiota bacterium]